MFVDEVKITVIAGKGGDGCVSFRREKYVPKGGPDGGNGGDGGNVHLAAVADIGALQRYKFKNVLEAESGKPGQPRKKGGNDGKDLVLPVPAGTLIKDTNTNETWELLKVGEKIQIAVGGKGGHGNAEFKSSTNTTPKQFERGGRGQKRNLFLELRLIADVGLIGLPNAGKSSLLNALTRAKAQVANYPFTTLEPNLGVMEEKILADIPGLIEGASEGKGLGHKFLRHAQRTTLLAHCISVESHEIEKDYKLVIKELEAFDKDLIKQPEVIILTKVDLVEGKQLKILMKRLKKLSRKVLPCSIYDERLLKDLRAKLVRLLK